MSACVGGLFTIAGLLDIGSLASYLVYVRQSAMPLNQFTAQVNFLLAALSGAERIFEMMNEPEELDEGQVTLCPVNIGPDGKMTGAQGYTGHFAWKVPENVRLFEEDGESCWKGIQKMEDGSLLVPLCGRVDFKNVVFGYTKERQGSFGVLAFMQSRGQKIALSAAKLAGAGKTTIINLINRFYEISGGEIIYDGINIQDIRKDDLRRSLSMVVQETHLFTGTIADNIRYGRLEASDEDVREAARIANADLFIRRLPDGYDTMLYADGANLSQGQRQLLAIARAAVSHPPVLILDEATSSVDTRTERLIEKGMDAIMEGRTVFVIAHRLSTVRNSKAIMVLEKGEIIERGDHDDLLLHKGRYYQLYTGQFELE